MPRDDGGAVPVFDDERDPHADDAQARDEARRQSEEAAAARMPATDSTSSDSPANDADTSAQQRVAAAYGVDTVNAATTLSVYA